MVDEYQDTNEAQSVLIALLAGSGGNVCCVGDDDQLLYSWRGAEPRNILAFGERFPAHRRIVLGRNYRSRAEILDAATSCVARNERRSAKALIAIRGPGGHVEVLAFATEREEARAIAGTIADALHAGTAPSEILVLARTGSATGPAQHALAQAGIPHRVLGSLGLYERSEVRDALAYLALLTNSADAQAFRRAVQSPRRGVGTATASRVVALARERHHGDLIAAAAHADQLSVRSDAARARLARFGAGLNHTRSELAAGRSLAHVVVAAMMIDGGLVRHHQQLRDTAPKPDQRRDAERVLEDLRSLCRAVETYEHQHLDGATLNGFLEHAAGLHAQELDPGEEDRRITVSTIHKAKGTEASLVILCACEERLLPSWRSLAAPDRGLLEEERRLFYVAATRARDRLVITHAARRANRPTGGPSAAAPARTHEQACALLRRPFAPGAIGFRAMTKVALSGVQYGGAQVAAFLNAQSVVQRLNHVVPGRWRQEFQPLPAELIPAAGASKKYLACRLIITLPAEQGGPEIEAVYEDVGEMDAGPLAGLKELYSDARKRAAVAAGIGAYLYTALEPVVLAIGSAARQVQAIRRGPGKSDLLVISAETEQWLRHGYQARMNTPAVRRDLGEILSHGEPQTGMGQGEAADGAAPPTSEQPLPPAEPDGGNGSGDLVAVDFSAFGPTDPRRHDQRPTAARRARSHRRVPRQRAGAGRRGDAPQPHAGGSHSTRASTRSSPTRSSCSPRQVAPLRRSPQ